MTFVTLIIFCVIALGIGLLVGSLVVEGMPRRPPGPMLLSGIYISVLGLLATVLGMILGA